MTAAVLNTPVFARIVSYPTPHACPVSAPHPAQLAGLHEEIAHTANGDIAYYRFGHGSPIVLQTGFRASLDEWNGAFIAGLAKHHQVILFDNRGVGRSIPDATRFTVQDSASDLNALIGALQLTDVTVIGWSMGGAVTAQLAIDHPHAVRRIVLMNAPAPGPQGVPVPKDIEATLSGKPGTTFNDVMATLFPKDTLPLAEQCFRDAMFAPPDYQVPTISADVTAGQSALLHSWSADASAVPSLRQVALPTLVLGGEDDAVLARQNSEALAKMIPHARLLMVRSAGHAMMYQYPGELAAAINRFVAGAGNASRSE